MLAKFAEELKQTRVSKNITLQQMANKTKIDFKFLQAIDEGNFAFLPEIYIRAFIKEYAAFVGLNTESTIKKFEAAKKGKYPPEENEKPFLQSVIDNENSEQEKLPLSTRPIVTYADINENEAQNKSDQKKNQILIAVIASAVLVIIVILFFAFFNSTDKIVVAERPYEESIEESPRYVEQTTLDTSNIAMSDSSASSVLGDSLLLKINSNEQCWVSVIMDDNYVTEFMLRDSSSKIIKASSSFKVIFGNSGGIQLFLNNSPLPFEGIAGSVRYAKITSAGLEYLSTRPAINKQ